MEVYQALILGIVQGLTELLPISSSAHFEIIKWISGWNIPDSFDVALHFGTLLAIVIYFFKDWLELIKGGFKYAVKKEKTVQGRMFWYIVLATIPGGIVGFILDQFFSEVLDIPIVIASALIIMGVILYLVDKKCKSKTDYEQMTLKQTFLIGVSQALAFIPGVSRSGVTMTTALVSCLSDTPVRSDVAMTGEVTLRGNVLPIGGLKEKSLAAHRCGISTVIIPKGNVKDLDDIPSPVREAMEFVPVERVTQVLDVALAR